MLSETDQRRYVMLLCLKCCNGDETLHDNEVAFQLRISNDEWGSTKETLLGKSLINDANEPTAWNKRQYVSDLSTDRVKKHRAKKKQECNVSETTPDTDTDTDTDNKETKKTTPFDVFYKKYPVKKSKDAAKKKWAKMSESDRQLAINGVGHYLSTIPEGTNTCHPSTYLNNKRWEDEQAPINGHQQQIGGNVWI